MTFTIPGLRYPTFEVASGQIVEGGFPSDFFPETHWAVFDEICYDNRICYDNGRANLSEVVIDRLQTVLKAHVGPGPVDLPQRRGLIERIFGVLEDNGFHRLVSTTGSSPKDPRRRNPEQSASRYGVYFEHIQELVEVLIAEYNTTPHGGVNHLSPLEAMRQRIQERGMLPRQLSGKRQEAVFLTATVVRHVRGSAKSGRRPHINYMGVVYRSPQLDESAYLVGKPLTLLVDLDDLRVIKAFLPDGSEFGNLVAEGIWGIRPHSVKVRKAIMQLASRQVLRLDGDPIEAYHRYLREMAMSDKRARNRLLQMDGHQSRPESQDVTKDKYSHNHSDLVDYTFDDDNEVLVGGTGDPATTDVHSKRRGRKQRAEAPRPQRRFTQTIDY
ncbi:MAG: hypothetical protein IMW91_06365 [Firmicutes bacterium]|nr:hypothetical protein [Bacillota bacterium]